MTVIDGKFLLRRIKVRTIAKIFIAVLTQTGKSSSQDSLFLLLTLIIQQ